MTQIMKLTVGCHRFLHGLRSGWNTSDVAPTQSFLATTQQPQPEMPQTCNCALLTLIIECHI